MNLRKKNPAFLTVLAAGLGLISAVEITAQTFTSLHSFTAIDLNNGSNNDGANPSAGLILSGNTLFGTTEGGGSSAKGVVFAINITGTGFTNLYDFTETPFAYTNSDGANPVAGLVLSSNTLYGTAQDGGSSGNGTVFKLNTDGTGFTTLHSFTETYGGAPYGNDDGAAPDAGLVLSGNTLYGTTSGGGLSANGTLFAVNVNGIGFTNLHIFTATDPNTGTNDDGAYPYAGLVLSGNTLYGTAERGGSSGSGTVFAINTDGTGFTNLHVFTAGSGSFPYLTNSDGAAPAAWLVLSGNTLYGTTRGGGSTGSGIVFAINTNGTGFANLHNFSGSDGEYPAAEMILSGNTLYGTTSGGGSSGNGTVFKVNTDGTHFTNLYTFSAMSSADNTNLDGAFPNGLVLSRGVLYGTAANGGASGNGTVFSISLPNPPPLTITRSATNITLTWSTNVNVFTLQSTTNLGALAVWTRVSPDPVIVNRLNTVTNTLSGTRQFYRLSD